MMRRPSSSLRFGARNTRAKNSRALRLVSVVCLTLWLSNWYSAEAVGDPLADRVKAAFLYRFTEFVTWPEMVSTAPFVIGVVGDDTMVQELHQIVIGRLIRGRPPELRRLNAGDSLDDCELIFVGDSERRRLAQIISAAPRGALIVTESGGALGLGSMINFVVVDGRVRFEIAANTAERHGVRLSSRLLAVALAVHTDQP